MNVPPPFTPPQPAPRKSNTALIVGIVLACVLIPCIGLIVVGAMGFNFFKQTIGPLATCGIGFEMVRTSILDYAQANGGKLPPAATWQDDVRPFYAKLSPDEYGPFEKMSADGDWGCKTGNSMTGIAYNSDLAGKLLTDIKDPYNTILIYEVEQAARNANGPYKKRSDAGSPMIMGERRGWLELPIKGDSKDFKFSSSGNKFEFKTNN